MKRISGAHWPWRFSETSCWNSFDRHDGVCLISLSFITGSPVFSSVHHGCLGYGQLEQNLIRRIDSSVRHRHDTDVPVPYVQRPNSVCGNLLFTDRNITTGSSSARFFLGLTESGLFPGVSLIALTFFGYDWHAQITFYLSLWYRRRDVAFRIAIFFSAATIAGKSVRNLLVTLN